MPDLFQYLNYRKFLEDWFAARKAATPRYSYRLFARHADQRSPSHLLHIIQGKRDLTDETTEAYLRALKLDDEEATHFRLLVQLDQAATADAKNDAWQRVSASRRFRDARALEGDLVDYFSHWYCVAIRELAHRDDFVPDPAWVADTIQPNITVEQAAETLSMLQRLGLLAEVDGRLEPADTSVVTPHEVAGLAARNYHVGMLRLAADSVERFGPTERHLAAVTVCIPSELMPQLKAEIDRFQERLLDLCDGSEGDRDRVHQVHLALFPLSKGKE